MKLNELMQAEDSSFELSLNKVAGRNVRDIYGYLTGEFGDPVFQITKVVFEDGVSVYCEGEHDLPYLGTADFDETINKLYEEENDDE